jgi:hypothetical protein
MLYSIEPWRHWGAKITEKILWGKTKPLAGIVNGAI